MLVERNSRMRYAANAQSMVSAALTVVIVVAMVR